MPARTRRQVLTVGFTRDPLLANCAPPTLPLLARSLPTIRLKQKCTPVSSCLLERTRTGRLAARRATLGSEDSNA